MKLIYCDFSNNNKIEKVDIYDIDNQHAIHMLLHLANKKKALGTAFKLDDDIWTISISKIDDIIYPAKFFDSSNKLKTIILKKLNEVSIWKLIEMYEKKILEDSFSDGMVYGDVKRYKEHVRRLRIEYKEFIDEETVRDIIE